MAPFFLLPGVEANPATPYSDNTADYYYRDQARWLRFQAEDISEVGSLEEFLGGSVEFFDLDPAVVIGFLAINADRNCGNGQFPLIIFKLGAHRSTGQLVWDEQSLEAGKLVTYWSQCVKHRKQLGIPWIANGGPIRPGLDPTILGEPGSYQPRDSLIYWDPDSSSWVVAPSAEALAILLRDPTAIEASEADLNNMMANLGL